MDQRSRDLEHWAKHALDQCALELAVLDAQIRPQKALAMLRRLGTAVLATLNLTAFCSNTDHKIVAQIAESDARSSWNDPHAAHR